MKVCYLCQKNYTDDELNFCLECGGTLTKTSDDSPPTVVMNMPRQTKPNWEGPGTVQDQSSGQHDPFKQGGNMGWNPPPAPIQGWQNQGLGANPPFQPPMIQMMGGDQTLPVVSMILGILSLTFGCCYGFGIFLSVPALITGYMGMNNANNNPTRYGGHGLAIAGLITGGIGTLVALGWIILFLIAILTSK